MITIHDLRAWKADGTRWAMLTAYDFPTAQILDRAGVPVLLVGDSVGRNVLGYPNELPVTMDEMLHHTRAVSRGVERAMVVGDMPFMSFQASIDEGVRNAGRLIKEGGAHAVKIEGPQLDLIHRLVDIGIPVMAHIGLTPQSVYGLGGYKVQGRGEAAQRMFDQATNLEKAGAFAIVLEAMPAELGTEITKGLHIPTIGIGGGAGHRGRGRGHRCAGARRARPSRRQRDHAETREEVRRPTTGDDRRRHVVRARRRDRRLPRRRPQLLLASRRARRPRLDSGP